MWNGIQDSRNAEDIVRSFDLYSVSNVTNNKLSEANEVSD